MLPASSVARNRGEIIATGLWGTSYFYSTRKDCCGMILNTMFSNKDEGTEDKTETTRLLQVRWEYCRKPLFHSLSPKFRV